MNNFNKVIIITTYTFSAFYLFGISVKLHNDRLIKYPNLKFHPIDCLNLSIMALSGFAVIKLIMKNIEMLENLD